MGRPLQYLSLAAAAFLSATLFPASSEALLLYLLSTDAIVWLLWLTASVFNTLGAIVNWVIGYYARGYEDRRWFPASRSQLERAENWFQRFGIWSLLLSWLPIVGDGLTVAAGLLRIRIGVFVLLVFIAKSTRYAAIVAVTKV